MARHTVCKVEDVEVGRLKPVTIGRSPVLVSRLPTGEIRALGGRCPHQGADLAFASLSGRTDGDEPNVLSYGCPGEVIRCPWHGFEFSLRSGDSLCPGSPTLPLQLRMYEVEIHGGDVVVVT